MLAAAVTYVACCVDFLSRTLPIHVLHCIRRQRSKRVRCIWDGRSGFSSKRYQFGTAELVSRQMDFKKYFESVLRFVFIAISAYVKWLFIEHACLFFFFLVWTFLYLVVNGSVVISLCNGLVSWCEKIRNCCLKMQSQICQKNECIIGVLINP